MRVVNIDRIGNCRGKKEKSKEADGFRYRCLEPRMRDFRDGLLSQEMIVSDICWYNSVPSVTIDSFNAILARKI